ncbi:PaaI family thioesterase [Rhodovibrionaceae bacterium A322]
MSEKTSLPDDPLASPDGFANLVGYRLVHWEDKKAVVELKIEKQHLNRTGLLHGGVLTTVLDAALGLAGTYCASPDHVRRAVTLALNTQFIGAGRLGMTLTATAVWTGGGRSIFFSSADVTDQNGNLLSKAEGTFKYRTGSGDPAGIPLDQAIKMRQGENNK